MTPAPHLALPAFELPVSASLTSPVPTLAAISATSLPMWQPAQPAQPAQPSRPPYTPAPAPSVSSLGSSVALDHPTWNASPATASVAPMRAPISRVLRVPRALLDLMADAAGTVGISEQDIWIEAARLWLREHSANDEPPPGAPAALANPRRARTWVAIDALLADLRQEPAVGTDTVTRGGHGNGSAA